MNAIENVKATYERMVKGDKYAKAEMKTALDAFNTAKTDEEKVAKYLDFMDKAVEMVMTGHVKA